MVAEAVGVDETIQEEWEQRHEEGRRRCAGECQHPQGKGGPGRELRG